MNGYLGSGDLARPLGLANRLATGTRQPNNHGLLVLSPRLPDQRRRETPRRARSEHGLTGRSDISLKRESAGHYVTSDGRYSIEHEEWWLDGECDCIMCQQGSECPNGGAAKREGWTIWSGGNHLTGEPFEFETLRDARRHLAHHLSETG